MVDPLAFIVQQQSFAPASASRAAHSILSFAFSLFHTGLFGMKKGLGIGDETGAIGWKSNRWPFFLKENEKFSFYAMGGLHMHPNTCMSKK